MKKLIMLILISAMAVSCNTEEKPANQFTVTGEIEGLDSHLYFRHPEREYSREYPSDSIIVTDGKFHYTDSISNVQMIRAYTKFSEDNVLFKIANGGGYYPVKSMYLMFFASPGATIEVAGEVTDFMNAYPSGNAYNDDLATVNRKAFPQFNAAVNLMVKASFESDTLKNASLKKESDAISDIEISERKEFLKNNPGSMATLYYLDDMLLRRQVSEEEAISLFDNLSEDLAGASYYKNIQTRVEGIRMTKEGMPVPVINTTSTPDGNEFDIASLKGKYVLIDFWGVWCGPCIAEMPTLQEYQEKYKDKLVVLGINSGDTKEKMMNFLNENGYEWQQLLSKKDNSSDNFVHRFNVQGFPTKFIIDPEGNIVKRVLGSGEAAFEMLDEILKDVP